MTTLGTYILLETPKRLPRFIATLLFIPVLLVACNTLAPEPATNPAEGRPEAVAEAITPVVTPLAAGTEVFPFIQVSAGGYHSCGLKQDGSVACWGYNVSGQATPPSVPVLTAQPTDKTVIVGTSFTLSVTATGTNPLTYQWRKDGTPVQGATGSTYTVSAATTDHAGSYDLIVTNTAGRATSEEATVSVGKTAQTLTFAESTPTTAERGSSTTLEVTSDTGTPIVLSTSPENVCTVSGSEVLFLAVGTCTVTATQAETANYSTGNATHKIEIVRTLTNTNLSQVSGSGTYGGAAILTATLKRADETPLEGKTIAFTVASADAGTAVTNANGVATLADVSLVGKDAGDYEMAASFAGDDDNALAASKASGTLTVAQATQAISFTSTAPTNPATGSSYTVSATATSGLAVTFSSTTESVCSVSGRTVSFESAGECIVAADQAGDDNYEAAPQQTQTTTVVPADSTGPVITPTVTGTLGSNGWYTNNVTVSWTVTDEESAITSRPGCDQTTISTDTAGVTLTCTAISDGGSSSDSVTIKRDANKPTLAPTVSATQILLNGSATATPNASDLTSGVASQNCATVLTNSVGTKNVTCTATDHAGNSASASAIYKVAYGFSGFSQPVDNNVPNKAKAGQVIPLKWRLTDASGAPVTTLGSVQLSVASLSCSFGTTPDAVEEYATGSSSLQNLGSGYYQYNWATPKSYASSCKTLQLNLNEGLYRTAAFQFTN